MSRSKTRVPLDVRALSGRVEIFRLPGAVERHPAVQSWLNSEPQQLRTIAGNWFAIMRRCGRDVVELMHDGCPVACIEDAAFGYVNTFKNHVNVGFFYGAFLRDPCLLLQGRGKRMRHVKLMPNMELNAAALSLLIAAAYADIKERVAAETSEQAAP